MQEVIKALTSKQVTDFIDQLEPTFKGLPHLPKGFVNFLATIAPWMALLGGVLGVVSGLGMLGNGLGFGMSWWMQLSGLSPVYFLVTGIIQLLTAGILLLAFQPLKARAYTGWILMFWNMVLSLVQSLVGAVLGYSMGSSLVGAVIGLAIGLYFLFEMKPVYSGKTANKE